MRRNKRNMVYRLTAAAVTASMVSISMAGSVFAGPPAAVTDEALYVNLDYYGNQVDSSVVKGVSLNGIRTFTDYGTYTDVTNMSNYAQPMIQEDGVTWELPADSKERFYYECQLNNGEVVLPWDFDVSYKLNGMPKEAQDLVHANGLVEMDIHCMPNKSARDYYKNNMILQVATMVDMEEVSSIEAPGSQTQSLGSYKVVVFAAVPGQEKTFHIEISTNDFESMGIIMMMIPGTLDQVNEISDIKDAKDTFADSTDELIDGMNEILDTLHSINNGMNVAQKGLEELQGARENFDASKDEMIANADNSLDSLEAVNTKINLIAPDINANKQALDEINGKVNGLVETLQDSGEDFYNLSASLRDLKDTLADLQSDLDSANIGEVKNQIKKLEQKLGELEKVLNQIIKKAKGAESLSEEDVQEQSEKLSELMEEVYEILDDLEEVAGANAVEKLRSQLDSAAEAGLNGEDAASLVESAAMLSKLLSSLQDVLYSIRHAVSGIDVEGGLKNGRSIANELASIMDNIDNIIGDVAALNKTKNDNKAAFDLMLDDAAASVEAVSAGTNNLITLLRSVQTTVKNNRAAVENGTKQTLNGLIDILEKAADTSDTTGKLQNANESMRKSVKDELDKIGDDTNLLEMNAEEALISFTSDKNPTPASIQIVLRTQEISEEDINDNAVDIEPAPVDVGVWQRIVNVFQRIWNAVTGIFS